MWFVSRGSTGRRRATPAGRLPPGRPSPLVLEVREVGARARVDPRGRARLLGNLR
jgi:hypothetical protein